MGRREGTCGIPQGAGQKDGASGASMAQVAQVRGLNGRSKIMHSKMVILCKISYSELAKIVNYRI